MNRQYLKEQYGNGHVTVIYWLRCVLASPGFLGESMKVFLAEGLEPGETHLEEDEEIELRLVKLSELLKMIEKGAILDGKTLTSVLLYSRLQSRNKTIAARCFRRISGLKETVCRSCARSPRVCAGAGYITFVEPREKSTFRAVFRVLTKYGEVFPNQSTHRISARNKEGRNLWLSTKEGQVVQQRQGLRIHRTRRRAGCIRPLLRDPVGRIQNAKEGDDVEFDIVQGRRVPRRMQSFALGMQPLTTQLRKSIGPGVSSGRPPPGGEGGVAPCTQFHITNYSVFAYPDSIRLSCGRLRPRMQ